MGNNKIEIVYQRRKKEPKTRDIQDLVDVPRQQLPLQQQRQQPSPQQQQQRQQPSPQQQQQQSPPQQQQQQLPPQQQQQQPPPQVPGATENKENSTSVQASSTTSRATPSSTLLPSSELSKFLLLLSILQRRDSYRIFAEPVDGEEVEHYYETIKEPMDFGTIETKINEGKYAALEQFEQDVMLVFNNAMFFNASNTFYYKQARAIREVAKKLFQALKSDPENFEDKFSGSKHGRTGKWTKADARLVNSSGKKRKETTQDKPQEAGSLRDVKSETPPLQRRQTYDVYTSASLKEKEPVLELPNFDDPKFLIELDSNFDYKSSLLNFVKDLGEKVQMIVAKRLEQIPQDDHSNPHHGTPSNQLQQPSMVNVTPIPVAVPPQQMVRPLLMRSPNVLTGNQMDIPSLQFLRPNTQIGSQATFPNWNFVRPINQTGDQVMLRTPNWNFSRTHNRIGGEMHLPGLHFSRPQFQFGDQVNAPISDYSKFNFQPGHQVNLQNSNYSIPNLRIGEQLNLRSSNYPPPSVHMGNQVNLRNLSFQRPIIQRGEQGNPSNLNLSPPIIPIDDEVNSPNLNLSRPNFWIGDPKTPPCLNYSRPNIHIGNQPNPSNLNLSTTVIQIEDDGNSPNSNFSMHNSQIGDQMNPSSLNFSPRNIQSGDRMNPSSSNFSGFTSQIGSQMNPPSSNFSARNIQIGNQTNPSSSNVSGFTSQIKEEESLPDFDVLKVLLQCCTSSGEGSSSSGMPHGMGDNDVSTVGQMAPSVDRNAGGQGLVDWMDHFDIGSLHRLETRTDKAGSSCISSSPDKSIPPNFFNRPLTIAEPQSDSNVRSQPRTSQTSTAHNAGGPLNEQETEEQIRDRKGKAIMKNG